MEPGSRSGDSQSGVDEPWEPSEHARVTKVLLVDDDVDVRETLSDVLSEHGFSVCPAANGVEALRHLECDPDPPDLILLDIMMPVMGGPEFLRTYAQRRELPRAPVVILTAFSVEDTAACDGHVVRSLSKPVDAMTLMQAVLYAQREGRERREASTTQRGLPEEQVPTATPLPRPTRRTMSSAPPLEEAARAQCILLVEDDDDIRDTIAELLEDEGYQVTTARNGAEALSRLRRGDRPAVVLTDLMMPVMTGWELVAQMRADRELASIPIIVTSAASDRAPPASDRVLSKPLNLDDLVTSVAELSRTGASAADTRNRALRDMAQRNVHLAQLQRLREEMSALVVHDMKGPLSAIVLNLQYATPLLPPGSEALGALLDTRAAAERLSRMVENMLHVVKMESGRFLPERTQVSTARLLGDLAQRAQAPARDAGITLMLGPVEDVELMVDQELLSRALDNLVDNALRHTTRGGRVSIGATSDGRTLTIQVGNTGAPIPRAMRASVFDKYGQIGRSGGRVNLGLGLYFCRLVADAHGASIGVGETADMPTVFSIAIPVG